MSEELSYLEHRKSHFVKSVKEMKYLLKDIKLTNKDLTKKEGVYSYYFFSRTDISNDVKFTIKRLQKDVNKYYELLENMEK